MVQTTQIPFTEPEWKIPGYTGYIHGLHETYKKTPIMAQLETKVPDPDTFIYTRTQVPPRPTPEDIKRDACNNPDNFRKPVPGNLWPKLQNTAIQASFKPPVSNIAFGDFRVDPFITNYGQDFKAPFRGHERLRSPNRNEDLEKTTASLADIYKSSYNRVGNKRLQKMVTTMRERMEAKLGNSNDNAFRMRKLFIAYDKEKNGMVHFEDLRQMCESFGMQLDDDSLLALYYVYDPEGTGYLKYLDLVKHLMHPDSFCYYLGYVDNSQQFSDTQRTVTLLNMAAQKFKPVITELLTVLKTFDARSTNYLAKHDLLAGCAALGVVLSDNELECLTPLMKLDEEGRIQYVEFCKIFQTEATAEGDALSKIM